jgi:hypothetical protein
MTIISSFCSIINQIMKVKNFENIKLNCQKRSHLLLNKNLDLYSFFF